VGVEIVAVIVELLQSQILGKWLVLTTIFDIKLAKAKIDPNREVFVLYERQFRRQVSKVIRSL
jgi:hypothetical protein